jgi:hypothetical protein
MILGKSQGWFTADVAWGAVPTGSPMSTERNPDQKVTSPQLGPDAREHIGAHLQVTYAEIEGQPIPDDQIDLLLALRRVERELGRKEL